jgi:RING finger family protein
VHESHSFPIFIFVLPFVLAIIAILFAAAQQQQRSEVLTRIARRFSGRLIPSDWFIPPQVRLQFRNCPAVLRFTKVGKGPLHTQFSIAWPDARLRCEVVPQNVLASVRKWLGTVDIEIGSRQFDADHLITGNNPAAIRELLNVEVQGLIVRLAALSRFGFISRDVQVQWRGGYLTVTKPCHLSTYEALEQFVTLSAGLFAAAMDSGSSGIEFVGEVQEPSAIASQCQVCGEPLTQDLVYCQACRTPHHRECWDYFGGCSTYACGGKKCLVHSKRRAAM